MNAVEIEEAVSKLAEQPFDTEEFPLRLPRSLRQQDDDDQTPENGNVQQVRPSAVSLGSITR